MTLAMQTRYETAPWSLRDLLPSTDEAVVSAAVDDLNKALKTLEAARETLTSDIEVARFLAFMDQYEAVTRAAYKLAAYASLWFSSDTQSQKALGFKGKVDQLMLDAQNRSLFFSLWWKELDDDTAERLMSEAGDLTYFLQEMRNFKPYTLSETEEQLINLKDVNGINGVITLYDMITNKFSFEIEIDGKKQTLTREGLMIYVRHPDPELRQAAYDELLRVYEAESTVLAQIYNYRVRDWANEQIQLRSFKTPISVRNLSNDIPDDVVDILLNVIQEESPVFHRYFALKAKWLGIPKLRRYDLYAPLSKSQKTIEYADAVNMVLDTFESFSPVLASHAQRVFDEDHVDSEVRKGKRGGAFCSSIFPELTPYVLMNYTGEVRDVATLAHEMGHAIHSMMAAEHRLFTFHSSLPMAETASVFSEMMLTDRLLAQEDDPDVRRDLLATAIDDAYATVLRQAYFVLFEREAHKMVMENKTVEELNAAYMANLTQQFGDVIDIDEGFKWEWIMIPHIYRVPFYCYAYSFGQLMVLSLYQQFKDEGASFAPKYLKILSYGGSASPNDILSEAGIDISSADFWRGGFRVLDRMIDELEAIG